MHDFDGLEKESEKKHKQLSLVTENNNILNEENKKLRS